MAWLLEKANVMTGDGLRPKQILPPGASMARAITLL